MICTVTIHYEQDDQNMLKNYSVFHKVAQTVTKPKYAENLQQSLILKSKNLNQTNFETLKHP